MIGAGVLDVVPEGVEEVGEGGGVVHQEEGEGDGFTVRVTVGR